MKNQIVARCIICNKGFTQKEIEGAICCPFCGDCGIPCSPKEDITIKINWRELRVLCIWAENWASKIKDESKISPDVVVESIARRLEKQYPNKTPLTLAGELGQLGEKFKVEKTNINETGRKIAGEFN